jgi:hypothetical protein
VAVTGAVSSGIEGAGCELAIGGAAGGGSEAASVDGAAAAGAATLAPVSVPGLAVAPGWPPYT